MATLLTPLYHDGPVGPGEQLLLDFLVARLPADYQVLPNLHLPWRNPTNGVVEWMELDAVVLAPHALYHLENKHWRGPLEGDQTTWFHNGVPDRNPLRHARFKSQILASHLKEHDPSWGRAWVETAVTLSYPHTAAGRQLDEVSRARSFGLDDSLLAYLQDPAQAKAQQPDKIASIQHAMGQWLAGLEAPTTPPRPRLFESEYEVVSTLSQSDILTELLIRPLGLGQDAPRKRVRIWAVPVLGLPPDQRTAHEQRIRNQYDALQRIGAAPNLLPVQLLADSDRGEVYEISDYLDHTNLRTWLGQHTVALPEKLALIRQVIQALAAAHTAGVLHRDVRPDNVYVTGAGALLGGFSRSFFWKVRRGDYTVMPTPDEDDEEALYYRAPELDDSVADASPATDLWGLGLTLAEALTGQALLPNGWHQLDHWGGTLPPEALPSAQLPNLPVWLDELVRGLVRLDPSARYPASMAELLAELDRGMATTTTLAISPLPVAASDGPLVAGARVGDYLLIRHLGNGGYAQVWQAKHGLQDKEVALKIFNESVRVDAVLDEYAALRTLTHPYIVGFEWNGQLPNGRFYTVMELLHGPTLADYAVAESSPGAQPRLPLSTVYQLADELIQALAYIHCHEPPIYHRDLKPSNIVWDRYRRFVLIDFNVAQTNADDHDAVGTQSYTPPDRVQSATHIAWDASCDTFALGVTLFELLCRQHPWATNAGSTSRLPSLSRPPADPATLRPDLSPALTSWLRRAIAPRAADRFATAADMQAALLAIGPGGLVLPPPPPATATNTAQFVDNLNRLFSQSKFTNAGTRARPEGLDLFGEQTYVKTRLDKYLSQDILAGNYRLIIITGNAGDGKTAFVQQLEEQARQADPTHFKREKSRNGARFQLRGVAFQSNYDGSQDEGNRANKEVLDELLAPFVGSAGSSGLANFQDASEGRLLAINEGRLIEYLTQDRPDWYGPLRAAVERFFETDGNAPLPAGLLLVNLNSRAVISPTELIGEASIFREQLRKLVAPEHWGGCATCAVREQCFIRYNAQSLHDADAGEEVLRRMERLLLTVHLRRELHITMRDLRSLAAFWLTRDYSCADVQEGVTQLQLTQRVASQSLVGAENAVRWLENYYFNISDTHATDAGARDRLVRLVRQTDVGLRALPTQDRALYYNPLDEAGYLGFGQREGNVSGWLQATRDQFRDAPAPTSVEASARLDAKRQIHRLLARHQYFEGRANPDLRLPYRAVGRFADILLAQPADQEHKLNEVRNEVASALAAIEGCRSEEISKRFVVLRAGEADNEARTYRVFPLEDFVVELNNLAADGSAYIERFPDRLIFRHKPSSTNKHLSPVRMTISLDLFELLTYLGEGARPSANDVQGRFQELQLFKNLLANLPYRQVLVTSNHQQFHSISADDANRMVVASFVTA